MMRLSLVQRDEGAALRLADDPAYAAAREQHSALQAEKVRIRQLIQAMQARGWLDQQRAAGEISGPEALAQAQRLLAGEKLPDDLRDVATQVRELEKRFAVIEQGSQEVAKRLSEIRQKASDAAGRRERERHRAALASLFQAAQALADAAAAEVAIRADIVNAGFELIEAHTPAPNFAIPMMMGELGRYDSAISVFRRQLDALGLKP